MQLLVILLPIIYLYGIWTYRSSVLHSKMVLGTRFCQKMLYTSLTLAFGYSVTFHKTLQGHSQFQLTAIITTSTQNIMTLLRNIYIMSTLSKHWLCVAHFSLNHFNFTLVKGRIQKSYFIVLVFRTSPHTQTLLFPSITLSKVVFTLNVFNNLHLRLFNCLFLDVVQYPK